MHMANQHGKTNTELQSTSDCPAHVAHIWLPPSWHQVCSSSGNQTQDYLEIICVKKLKKKKTRKKNSTKFKLGFFFLFLTRQYIIRVGQVYDCKKELQNISTQGGTIVKHANSSSLWINFTDRCIWTWTLRPSSEIVWISQQVIKKFICFSTA